MSATLTVDFFSSLDGYGSTEGTITHRGGPNVAVMVAPSEVDIATGRAS
ncbi:hypothetical protein [Humibacter sp. RRB41]|nr:hypothetical protein [Humibacter sp. RRB41]